MGKSDQAYDQTFFSNHSTGMHRSAEALLPLIMDVVKPRRMIDIGCGEGHWLKVAKGLGATEVLGIDGSYVDRSRLVIEQSEYRDVDLGAGPHTAASLGLKPFDLCISLEVAEHLESRSAQEFVDLLCSVAPVILFSAAIPYQGGTHHVNEQWPDYWFERFSKRGYQVADTLRPAIWDREDIQPWYVQNVMIYARPDGVQAYPELAKTLTNRPPQRLVHPRTWVDRNKPMPFKNSLRHKIKRVLKGQF